MQKSMVKNSFSSTTDELKYKIIIVGDSSVGKSALFMKFTYGEVDDEVRTKVTMIDFKLKEVFVPEEIQSIKLFIWDTAGQQRYRSIVSTYFKGCHGVLLVFDVSEPKSFQNIKSQWLPILKKKAQFATIMLVGNKCDLQQKVDEPQVLKFAKQNRLVYIKTSVKQNKNVGEAFTKLTSMVNAKRHLLQKPQSFYLKKKTQTTKRNCCLLH